MGIKTIIGALRLSEVTGDPAELLEYAEAECSSCFKVGDLLGAGEWTANKIVFANEGEHDELFAKALSLWASSENLKSPPTSLSELLGRFGEYVPEDLTTATVALCSYLHRAGKPLPPQSSKLAYRLEPHIRKLFALPEVRQTELLASAISRFDAAMNDLQITVRAFCHTNCVTAKRVSVDLVKKERQYRRYVLSAEQPMITALDGLLGATFRRFCECYEQQNVTGVIGTARDLQDQASKLTSGAGKNGNSTFWNVIVNPVAMHVETLIEEGRQRSAAATTPKLVLAPAALKLDLTRVDRQMTLLCRLNNEGDGRATEVKLVRDTDSNAAVEIELLDPVGLFDIDGRSEQLIGIGVTCRVAQERLVIPIAWQSKSITGSVHNDNDTLSISQQRLQPNWDALLRSPPYSLNPIKLRANLYGRDEVLTRLMINATSGTSTFLWGQKRVGKTSILQVLAGELARFPNFFIILLRMGEVIAMHEGQIAYLIASRMHSAGRPSSIPLPEERAFGAGMGALVPFAEAVQSAFPDQRYIIVIDEFDDLSPAFYTGERGRQFVKALRSLSETGLTFFFVGSERMNTIYERHQLELNKWVNESLDRIESREACKELIVAPVSNSIDFQRECVDRIVDYCGRNPFYLHQICHDIFMRCFSEKTTFVSDMTLKHVQSRWLKAIGASNFAHFWEDNPELDEAEKTKQAAENCLVLCCISTSQGGVESGTDLHAQQDALGLGPSERMSSRDCRAALDRLVRRGVLQASPPSGTITLTLPVFHDWLRLHAEVQLLPRWRKYTRIPSLNEGEVVDNDRSEEAVFPISDEDLLAVSQPLVYCGKQKDATEIKVWLKQFDDDVRIEIAYSLLKRLSENGFVSDGAMANAYSAAEDAVTAIRKRMGAPWTVVKGKKSNLCISYVDSEIKSGANTAREMVKRLRPSKSGSFTEILPWMRTQIGKQPLVVFVDDFSASGSTMCKGMTKFKEMTRNEKELLQYWTEGRIVFLLLYALPDAIGRMKDEHPEVNVVALNVFGDEVRAFEEESRIFSDANEAKFAEEVILQLGRELYPAFPRGFNDAGALVCFQNTIPNNTLPIFWSSATVAGKPWRPLFPRA